jgi:NAD(P)-dependent dehydrogenase (short-subunit alcohol dehydrogenase family)
VGILSKFKLEDKIAIVTGAARGLGMAMANGLAEAGANIVIPDIDYETAEKTARDLANKGVKTLALKTDVADENNVANMVFRTIDEFGKIDILVNNAGIGKQIPAEKMSKEDWEDVININLTGVFLCAREVGKKMIEARQGSIINIASMSGYIVNYPLPQTAQASYNASKAGVVQLTKSLAAEWAGYNIRVNAIAPGYMKTKMTANYLKMHPEMEEIWVRLTPMKRMGLPEELQGAAVYLASDASSFMTGNTLIIDGGYTTY